MKLLHGSEYNMTNIFRVSHILPTHCRIKIQQNMTSVEIIGHIVRWKRVITSYWLTCKISTI